MRVVFLGTSSAMPTPHRYLPAVVLVRLGELFMFDCGEAAQIQFRRARLRFSRLRWILISHLHGDHITGLMGFLMSLQMSEHTEAVRIVGPEGIRNYVLQNKRMLQTHLGYPVEFTELAGEGQVVFDGPEYVIEAAALDHRLPTYGYAVAEKDRPGRFDVATALALGVPEGPLFGQLQSGRAVTLPDGSLVRPEQVLGTPRPGQRVAYVSDTRPCRNAVILARRADLLIHEGTFDAELVDEARLKKHSTVVEAAETARDAEAKHLVLTHFSPRYLHLEELRRQAAEVFPNVDAATDLAEYEV